MKANKQIRINATLKNKDTELDIHVNISKENTELDPMVIISCKETNDNLYDEYDKHIPTKNQLKVIGITDDDADKLVTLSNYEYVDASTILHYQTTNTLTHQQYNISYWKTKKKVPRKP